MTENELEGENQKKEPLLFPKYLWVVVLITIVALVVETGGW